jgi:hypothetical protein
MMAEVLLPSEPAAPSAGVLRAVRSAQARKRLKQEAIASLNTQERAWLDGLSFVNEAGGTIDARATEWHEQILALQHVQPHHRVLELGARYGTVSCALQYNRPARHVAVEPDARVWAALAANLAANDGCEKCEVFEGFASRRPLVLGLLDAASGYGARAQAPAAADAPAACRTVEDLERHADGTRQPFTALIADCEGFLGTFLDENPRLLDGLELVVYEADAPDVCDYAGIRRLLRAHAFECVVAGEQNVWRRRGGARATA